MKTKALRTRREEILARAETHFAQYGYQGASLSAIARDARIGNPGLLHHFPSKAKLYRAVLEALAQEVTQRLAQRLAPQASPQARLKIFVDVQVEWMLQRPAGFRVIQRELLDNAERVKAAHTLPLQSYLLTSLELIVRAQQAGVTRTDVSAIAILCIILGALSYAASVRPTFVEAFAGQKPGLESASRWTALVGESVLRMVTRVAER